MIEIMSHLLRKNEELRGFRLFDKEVKLTAFTDDVTIFMDGTERDLITSCSVLESFGAISGLKVNYEKSAILRIGPHKNSSYLLPRKKVHVGIRGNQNPRNILYK